MPTAKEASVRNDRGTVAMVHGTADVIIASGDSSGPFATDALNIADELSAISMTKKDYRKFLRSLKTCNVAKKGKRIDSYDQRL